MVGGLQNSLKTVNTTTRSNLLKAGKVLFVALVAAFGFATAEAQAATRWETLHAIHMVENPSNSPKPGPFGELGAYQFRSSTWEMYTKRPFSQAIDRSVSDEVAVQHYEWLKSALVRAGMEPSVYNIAMAWNAGIGSVIRGTVPSVARNYASRVENIANDLNRRLAQERAASLVSN